MKIRNVKESEIAVTTDIIVRGWQTAYRGIIADDFLDNLDRGEITQRRLQDYKTTNYIVAIEDNTIVGVCRYIDNEDNDYIIDGVKSEIIALYVEPNLKGNGIGSKIFEYVKDDLKRRHKNNMILWCLKDNTSARKFYEKHGGILVGEKTITFGGQDYVEVGYQYKW